ncbi:hypothetical protein Sinme_4525 [Sinorhizobium meliloti AK83]|nr:hypothetical protein Sinme_4525 [Sinorhizobium meliloti AK83]SEJ38548.1 hypothetical protein SAMN04244575_04180 [Sinorhizobium meliloti]
MIDAHRAKASRGIRGGTGMKRPIGEYTEYLFQSPWRRQVSTAWSWVATTHASGTDQCSAQPFYDCDLATQRRSGLLVIEERQDFQPFGEPSRGHVSLPFKMRGCINDIQQGRGLHLLCRPETQRAVQLERLVTERHNRVRRGPAKGPTTSRKSLVAEEDISAPDYIQKNMRSAHFPKVAERIEPKRCTCYLFAEICSR